MAGKAVLLVLTMMLGVDVALAAGEEDEAWIAAYIASGKAPGVTLPASRTKRIEFGQLSNYVGRRVRVDLRDGRERRGLVEHVDGSGARLRSQFGGGFFRFTLSRDQIRDIRVD